MLWSPFFSAAEDVSLHQLAQELGLEMQWDPVSSRGSLVRDTTFFSFFPGTSFAVINFQRVIPIDPIYWASGGGIMVPAKTANRLQRLFPQRDTDVDRRVSTIFIDPGHGGKDPGAIGRHTINGQEHILQEKDVVLDVSRMLYEKLRTRYPDRNIVMSRSDDRYIELIDRYEMANAIPVEPNDSILFVSIHANASINSRAQGFEVWYLPPEFRRTLISEEDFGGRQEVVPILNSMLEEEFTIQSILLGQSILDSLDRHVGTTVPNRGLKQETFAVVRGARMPSVLVELGFLTNKEEFTLLRQEDYLLQIAEGIYNGVHDFIYSFEQ